MRGGDVRSSKQQDRSPESLSVKVKTKEVESLSAELLDLGPKVRHPSGWQKDTMFKGSGKSCKRAHGRI